MRAALLLASALGLTGCILDRSGTSPDRSGLDAALDAARADGAAPGLDAGPPSACSPGDGRSVPCGGCGTQAETCAGGVWVPAGACTEVPPCEPGAIETSMEACGMCGQHARTRTCLGCAGWGGWSDFGACGGEGACAIGTTRTRTEPCACGAGTAPVTDTCNGSCEWSAGSAGACSHRTCRTLLGEICPGDRAWIGCSGSLGLRNCRCDGTTGDWVECDERGC